VASSLTVDHTADLPEHSSKKHERLPNQMACSTVQALTGEAAPEQRTQYDGSAIGNSPMDGREVHAWMLCQRVDLVLAEFAVVPTVELRMLYEKAKERCVYDPLLNCGD
jgi:hypothetical protein